jgi:hypothetical protein
MFIYLLFFFCRKPCRDHPDCVILLEHAYNKKNLFYPSEYVVPQFLRMFLVFTDQFIRIQENPCCSSEMNPMFCKVALILYLIPLKGNTIWINSKELVHSALLSTIIYFNETHIAILFAIHKLLTFRLNQSFDSPVPRISSMADSGFCRNLTVVL